MLYECTRNVGLFFCFLLDIQIIKIGELLVKFDAYIARTTSFNECVPLVPLLDPIGCDVIKFTYTRLKQVETAAPGRVPAVNKSLNKRSN
jgi:hypothetical protein